MCVPARVQDSQTYGPRSGVTGCPILAFFFICGRYSSLLSGHGAVARLVNILYALKCHLYIPPCMRCHSNNSYILATDSYPLATDSYTLATDSYSLATDSYDLHPSNRLLHTSNRLLHTSNRLLHPSNRLLQPSNGLLHASNGLLHLRN